MFSVEFVYIYSTKEGISVQSSEVGMMALSMVKAKLVVCDNPSSEKFRCLCVSSERSGCLTSESESEEISRCASMGHSGLVLTDPLT